MSVKRSLWTYLEMHGLLSLFFGLFFALGLGAYFSGDGTQEILIFGLTFSCIFGTLFCLTQLAFAGIYCFGGRDVLEVKSGVVTLKNWGKTVHFPLQDIVRWDYHPHSPTNSISFWLYDGRYFVADAVKPLSDEQRSELGVALSCPEGETRQLHPDVELSPVSHWVIKRDLSRWPYLLLAIGIVLSLFTAWAWVGFGLGAPSEGPGGQELSPYNPIVGAFAGISSLLWLVDWMAFLILITLPKQRAIFTDKEVIFRSRGKEIHLPYSEIRSIKEDQAALNGAYSVLAVPCLYLQSKNETYTIRFVKVSEENGNRILQLSGFACNDR
jgi:hypothetical protein